MSTQTYMICWPPKMTYDPDGDAEFEIQKNRFLVSSKALSLASPVFKAMFKPYFKREGPILLPEDDREAFDILCNVVHHCSADIPHQPSLACLVQLTTLCDKYDCIRITAAYCSQWIQNLSKDAYDEDMYELLLVSYIMDLPEAFSMVSWKILKTHEGTFTALPGLENHPLVREDLLVHLNMRKLQIMKDVHRVVLEPFSTL